MKIHDSNRINPDWQGSVAELPVGYAERWTEIKKIANGV